MCICVYVYTYIYLYVNFFHTENAHILMCTLPCDYQKGQERPFNSINIENQLKATVSNGVPVSVLCLKQSSGITEKVNKQKKKREKKKI